MREFKEKIAQNYDVRRKIFEEKRMVKIELEENLVVKVDRGKLFVNENELSELIKDIFSTDITLKENTIIDLDQVCDVYYKLNYIGKNNNELILLFVKRYCKRN